MSDYDDVPDIDELTKNNEGRRAMLRRAIKKFPNEAKFRDALQKSFSPTFIRRAAKNGVFICYTQVDAVFALDIAIELREAGVRAFMDELDVPDGEEWGSAVNKAMRDCGVLLLILSPDSITDAEVQGERIFFLRKGKIIIPLIAKQCSTNGLEMFIEPINYVADAQIAKRKLLSLLRSHDGVDPQTRA
jgi:hypothetical protein